MADTQLDRIEKTLTAVYEGLFKKTNPWKEAIDENAPPKFIPVPGTEIILGPKPFNATELAIWTDKAKRISAVTTQAPSVIANGVLVFAERTRFFPPAYMTYDNQDVVVLRTGIRDLWVTPFKNFEGSNVEGVIRAFLDAPKG